MTYGTRTSTAGGNINPARFVKDDTSNDFGVLQCGAGEKAIGVSQMGGRSAPTPDVTTNYAAISGEQLAVHVSGQAYITAGEALANGVYLKSDADGKAVAIDEGAGTEEHVIARAIQTAGGADEIIKIEFTKFVKTTET